MSKVDIEIDEKTLKGLVLDYVTTLIGSDFCEDDVRIQVKSRQNYRSEWETADFRAVIHRTI